MNTMWSSPSMDEIFDRFRDSDGLLRDHGLTSMLLQSGFDQELAASVVRRAQWLNEHYGSLCLTRDDFELLLDESGKYVRPMEFICHDRGQIYSGNRRGVVPMAPVKLGFEGTPSRDASILQAAKLGLEIENDVRVATDRLNKLKLPVVSSIVSLPVIAGEDDEIRSLGSVEDHENIAMPLL